MATALECPACGYRHRLDAVGDDPVFTCSRCERQLKLPAQFRVGAAARPGAAAKARPASNRPVTNRGTGGRPAAGGRPVSKLAASPSRCRGVARSVGTVRIPLKILAWVVAFVLGAGVVRVIAGWTGFVDTNTFLDLMLDRSFAAYWRLIVIIPVWAFFATVIATAFIEAPDWWARRSAPPASKPVISRRVPAGVPAGVPAKDAGNATGSGRASPRPRPTARRVPPRSPAAKPSPSPSRRSSEPPTREPMTPVAARPPEPSPPPDQWPDQRPRRIPRRDTGS